MNNLKTIKSIDKYEDSPNHKNLEAIMDNAIYQSKEGLEMSWTDEKEKRFLMKSYKKFNKAKSTQKFRAFLTWVESSKSTNLFSLYHYLKDFYFSTSQAAMHLYQKSKIFCMALSPDDQTLIVGCNNHSLYLWNLSTRTQFLELKGHENKVTCIVTFNNLIYSGSYDNTIKVWDYENYIDTIIGHSNPILSLTINTEGTKLASGSEDHTIIIWNLKTKTIEGILKGHTSPVDSVIMNTSSQILISGSWDLTIRVWSLKDYKELKILEGHKDLIRSLAIVPERNQLISGSADKMIKIWDLLDYKLLFTLEGHTNVVRSLSVSPNGKYLASGSSDKTVRIWNLNSRRIVSVLEGHTDRIRSVLISRDGSRIISGCWDKIIRIWPLKEQKDKHFLKGHYLPVLSIIVSFDGSRAYSSGKDGCIFIWDLINFEKIIHLEGASGVIHTLDLHPNGLYLISAGDDGNIYKWNLLTYGQKGVYLGHLKRIVFLKFSLNGDKIISLSLDKSIRIWDFFKEIEENCFKDHKGTPSALELSYFKNIIITGNIEGEIFLWTYPTLILQQSYLAHSGRITFIKLFNEENSFASGSEDSLIKLWELTSIITQFPRLKTKNGNIYCKTLSGHKKSVLCGKINQKSDLLMTGGEDHTIRIWNLVQGVQIAISANNIEPIYALTTSFDGNQLLYSGECNYIKIRRISKIKTMNILKGEKAIKCLDISQDEGILVSGSDENNLIVWDLKKIKERGVLQGHSSQILTVKITNNNQKVLSGSADNTIRVWDLISLSLIGILKGTSHKITCMGIFNKDRYLLSGSYDNSLRLWDLKEMKHLAVKYFHSSGINALVIDPNESRFFSAGKEGYILVGDLKKLREITILKGHSKKINDLALTNDGIKLVSGSSDCTIKIWHAVQNKLLYSLDIEFEVYSIGINASRTKLLLGLGDKAIQMWDFQHYKRIAILEGHSESVNAINVLSKSRRLVSGSNDSSIRVWDLVDTMKLPFIEGHCLAINEIAVSPNGDHLITAGKDRRVILWDLKEGRQLKVFHQHSWMISAMALTLDGLKTVTATYSVEIKIWDMEKNEVINNFSTEAPIECLILSPDENWILIGCCDSFIRIMDFHTGKILKILEKHSGSVKSLCLDSTGKRLISSGADNFIIVWDLNEFQVKNTLIGHKSSVTKLLCSLDDRKLYSGSDDKSVIIWDLYLNNPIAYLKEHTEPIRTLALLSIEQILIVGCCPEESWVEGSFIFFWDLVSLKKIRSLDCLYGCRALVLTPCTKQLIAASEKSLYVYNLSNYKIDKVLRGFSECITFEFLTNDHKLILATDDYLITIWDLKSCKRLAIMEGHQGCINACVITKNGCLISASDDKSIRIWDLNSGVQKSMLQGHSNSINSLAIGCNESILVSGSNDKSIRVWDLEKKKQIKVLSSHLDNVTVVKLIKKTHLISSSQDRTILLWTLPDFKENRIVGIANSGVVNMVISPDEKLFLLITNASKMQIWTTKDFEWINETEIRSKKTKSFQSLPMFLSETDCRLVIYFNKIYDCYNGETIVIFQIYHEMISFYFDSKSLNLYYLTPEFELHQMDEFWINNYIYMYLNFDSLSSLAKDENIICNKTQSTFPFFLSFLHLIAIFEKKDFFTSEKMKEVYGKTYISLDNYFHIDIFFNTPLDILIVKKNTNLIFKYFDLIFENFDNPETPFLQKVRFLNYKFKNHADILDKMIDIIDLCEDDYSILDKILNRAFLDLDPKIYANNLIYDEMEEPIVFETNSLFNIDKYFIEKQMKERSKGKSLSEKTSIVKCKIICLPHLNDICNPKAAKIFAHLSDGSSINDIFCNDVLYILVHYIWETQTKFYYKIATMIFLFFFILFNINFIWFFKLRMNNDDITLFATISIIIDILLIIYGFYCATNELWQMVSNGFLNYFDSIWNYFDIILIPLIISSSFLDIFLIIYDSFEELKYIKLVFALCMFCFWFRFLSFFRAIKETASTMRLILNVITGVRHFVMFMVLFMLTLTGSFLMLINDTSAGLWTTFYSILKATVGDYDDIESLSTDFDIINEVLLISTAFLFAVILLNLLVAILGDKHNEINEAEEKTRLYELTNILQDTNSELFTKIIKWIKKPKERGTYLVYLYNEKHERVKVNQYEGLEKKIDDVSRETNRRIEKLEELARENYEKLNEYIEEMREKHKQG